MQGLIIGLALPPPVMAVLLAIFYLRYQQVEYNLSRIKHSCRFSVN